MKQCKIKNKIMAFIFRLNVLSMCIKELIAPEKPITMSRDNATKMYSRLIDTLKTEETICKEIHDLSKKVSDQKNDIIPELRDFDFELFKYRFRQNYFLLSDLSDSLRESISCKKDENLIKIYKSFLPHIKKVEDEMNLRIELMRLIKKYSESPENSFSCITSRKRKVNFVLHTFIVQRNLVYQHGLLKVYILLK